MAGKTKYRKHLEAICGVLHCVRDAKDDESFLDDLEMLRKFYRKLYKAQKYIWLYPTAPPVRYNEMELEITECRKVIIDICTQRDIGYQFFATKEYEFKKLEMPVRLMRNGYVMNEYLDF